MASSDTCPRSIVEELFSGGIFRNTPDDLSCLAVKSRWGGTSHDDKSSVNESFVIDLQLSNDSAYSLNCLQRTSFGKLSSPEPPVNALNTGHHTTGLKQLYPLVTFAAHAPSTIRVRDEFSERIS